MDSTTVIVDVTFTISFLIVTSFVIRFNKLSQILMAGALVRLALIAIHFGAFVLPDSQIDAVAFEQLGYEISLGGFKDALVNVRVGPFAYSWFIGILYSLIGRNLYVVMLINSFVSMMTVVYAVRTAELLSVVQRKHLLYLGLALCIHPTFALYSVIPLREAVFTFFFVFALYQIVAYMHTKATWRLVVSGTCIALGAVLHSSLVVLYAAVGYALYRRNRTQEIAARPVVLLIAFGIASGVLYLMYVTNIGFDKLGLIAQGFDAYYDRTADVRTAYLTDLSFDAWYDYLWQVPVRMVFFLLMPFPWMVSTMQDVFACFDALIWAGLLFMLVRHAGFRHADMSTRPVLIALLLMTLVMAMGTPGYGAGIRHRTKILPVMLIATTAAFSGALSRKRSLDVGYSHRELERWEAASVVS